jgi:uncharacterized protein
VDLFIEETTPEQRTWGMLCHLSALIGMFAIPTVGQIVGPLIVWLVRKDRDPFVDDQGRESLNFQITVSICGAMLSVAIFISSIFSVVLIGLPFLVLFGLLGVALWVGDIICTILAAVDAHKGRCYRYPLSLRFL